MPSMISTENRSRQRVKSSSGKASPADTQSRSDDVSKRFSASFTASIPA